MTKPPPGDGAPIIITMGIDLAKGPDQTSYHCTLCGPLNKPCHHWKDFVASKEADPTATPLTGDAADAAMFHELRKLNPSAPVPFDMSEDVKLVRDAIDDEKASANSDKDYSFWHQTGEALGRIVARLSRPSTAEQEYRQSMRDEVE